MTRGLIGLAVAVAIAGCGQDERGSATTTTSTTAPAMTTRAAGGGVDPLAGASTSPAHAAASNRETALLTAVRAGRHEGYDRVVFEFRHALPGYDVRYVARPVTEDGSGRPVPVAGGFAVRIRMENALDADLTQASAPPTYTGPRRIRPGTPELAELARAGGFEGVVTWVAGVRDRVDFRVTTLSSPPRLVVDFRNH